MKQFLPFLGHILGVKHVLLWPLRPNVSIAYFLKNKIDKEKLKFYFTRLILSSLQDCMMPFHHVLCPTDEWQKLLELFQKRHEFTSPCVLS